MINSESNPQLKELKIAPINMQAAKRAILQNHYMRTWPNQVKIAIGVFYEGRLCGVMAFGYTAATAQKVKKHTGIELPLEHCIEMQRMWISDRLGHNVESFSLSRAMQLIKKAGIKLVFTNAGGCKNDCGFVYQSSSWLYFGREPCEDFYRCADGTYRNLVSEMRFGRVKKTKGMTNEQLGRAAFGDGELVKSWRYNYAYPISKSLRKKLTRCALEYPKESAVYRFNQQWQGD